MVQIYTDPAGMPPVTADTEFRFHCHAGLACFNRCCQNPTIILKPYDILRLRRCLGITSTAFLARYTVRVLEEVSGLPLRLLAEPTGDAPGCPFLTSEGCGVYADRPAACRLFPVVQGSQLTEAGVVDRYFLKKLDGCEGFAGAATWTLSQWRQAQGLEPYDASNGAWTAILLQLGARTGGSPSPWEIGPFEVAVYDLDAFRRFVLETAFASTYVLGEEVRAILQEDDLALLELGYAYARLRLGLGGAEALQEVLRAMVNRRQNS